MKILITGANGFVGRALTAHLSTQSQLSLRGSVRERKEKTPCTNIEFFSVGDINSSTNWLQAVAGVDVVVHLAGRVHVMREQAQNPLETYKASNVSGSLHLAQMSAAAGVKRFIFISSIKVNGETTPTGQPFTEDSALAPHEPYGISKLEAEDGLRQLGQTSGLEITILRPPLIYGPGVRANFANLANAVAKGMLLPLGAIHNQRSLLAIDNLTDLIATCLSHPAAANQTFLVSDGEDLSTTALVQRMAQAMGRRVRLLPIPASVLTSGATLLGQRAAAQRLCGNLQIDSSKARSLLGWVPPVSVDEGLRRALAEYRA